MRISDWSSDVCSSDLMDDNDLQLYIHRLAKATLVLEKHFDKSQPAADGAVRYRAKTTEDAYYTVHVRMITKEDGAQFFHLWTDHSDGCSNYAICDRLRPGEEPTDPSDPDYVLDRLYLLDDEVKLTFSDYGRMWSETAKEVDAQDAKSQRAINPLIQ